MPIHARLAGALTLTAVLAASAAHADAPRPQAASPLLWATIDVCNTRAHPDTVGVRGSMPGTGDGAESMTMAFALEYRSPHGHWVRLPGATSAAVGVGSAAVLSRQAGQDFRLAPRTRVLLRGIVIYSWTLGTRSVAGAVRATHAGHVAAAGADPPGYSSATCVLP